MATLLDFGTICRTLICVSLFIVAAYLALYYLLYLRQVKRWKQANIPFLQPTFLLGHRHFWNMTKYSVSVAVDKIYKENQDKGLFGFFMGTLPVILVKDPKLIHKILVKNSGRTFGTGFETAEFEVESQYMMPATSNKTKWKTARTIMSPVLSPTRLAGSGYDLVKKENFKLLQNVEQTELNAPVNISNLSRNFVMNALIFPNFGIACDSDKKARAAVNIIDTFFEASYRRLLGMLLKMQMPDCFQIFEPFKFVSSYACKTMAGILKDRDGFKDQPPRDKCSFIDYIQSFEDNIALNNENNESDLPHKYEALPFRGMIGLSLTLLVGGSDSMVQVICFAIHLLSLHPEYQNKIRQEVCEVLKKQEASEFNFEIVQDFSFTLQCLYETARLYPIQPLILRQCSENFQIPDTEYILQKGDRILVAPYSMHYDPKYFQNPHQFDPDRFSSEKAKEISPEVYWSFGGGIRKCPGMKQGLMVAASFVASLLHKNEIKPHSHRQQMDATDFVPQYFANFSKRDILVDIVRPDNAAETKYR